LSITLYLRYEEIEEMMSKAIERKNYLLRIAARYIREHAPEETIFYDGTDCDGACLADECECAADME
jgi:hypothetical protein